jgi:replicative superfamily II helicase
MPKKVRIPQLSTDATINLALDTISKKKQALVFVNTKRSAEKTAEEISKKIKKDDTQLNELSEKVLKVVSRPTRQCERLARCVKKGVAFHHAGLHARQKELVEDAFRNRVIKIIACTPTLAAGLELPAFRTILKDLKRYGHYGLQYIPVLEYHQMCLPYEENIITDKGELRIGEVCKNKIKCRVLSFDTKKKYLRPSKIKRFFIRKTHNLLEFETTNGFKLRLTKEHPIYTKEGWKKAANLKEGDKVLFCVNHQFIKNKEIDLFDLVPLEGTYIKNRGSLILKTKEKLKISEKEIAKRFGIYYKTIYHYKNNIKAMPFYIFIRLCELLGYRRRHIKNMVKELKTAYGNSLRIKKLDKDFFWMLGILATDGNLQKTLDKRTGSEYTKIRIFNTNPKIVRKSKRILENLIEGKATISRRRDGLYTYEIGSTLLGRILNESFGIPFKDKTTKLKITNLLFNAPREMIGSYLAGVFDGDGSFTRRFHKRFKGAANVRVLFVTSSKDFAVGLQKLLLKMGVLSKFYADHKIKEFIIKNKKVKFRQPRFYVTINEKKFIKILSTYVKPIKTKINVKYSTYHNLNKRYDYLNDYSFLKVKKITNINYKDPIDVFNIQVRTTNNYFASNFLVHNCGRAGRPSYDKYGEAIALASTKAEKDKIYEKYILGEPEDIYSKLAVEPVLRTYILSLIAANFVNTRQQILNFFERTFWAFQFKDMDKLIFVIEKMLNLLEEWEFVKSSSIGDFQSADTLDNNTYKATMLGKRVAELYIDPLTAHELINAIRKAASATILPLSLLQMVSHTIEMRPLLKTRTREWDNIQDTLAKYGNYLLEPEPSMYEPEYEDFIDSIKTALFMQDWIDEKDEEYLLETYNIRPGEIRVKLDLADWLLYATEEITRILQFQPLIKEIKKLRLRLKHGAKEELLPLLRLKDIGRVRARKLFNSRIRDIAGIKKANITALAQILGKNVAMSIKEQVGQDFSKMIVPEKKRKGQLSLRHY